MIQAIETRFKGYRFRSRLEARWAVFFDAMKYRWRYEDQGYYATLRHPERLHLFPEHVENVRVYSGITNDAWKNHFDLRVPEEVDRCGRGVCEHGAERVQWLPDFVIDDALGIRWHVEVKGSSDMLKKDIERITAVAEENELQVIVLSDVPYHSGRFGLQLHPFIKCARSGSASALGYFAPGGFYQEDFGAALQWFFGERWNDEWHLGDAKLPNDLFIDTKRAYPSVLEAYAAARASRFEHGESGAWR